MTPGPFLTGLCLTYIPPSQTFWVQIYIFKDHTPKITATIFNDLFPLGMWPWVWPGVKDAVVGLQLPGEAIIGTGDWPALPDVGLRHVHRPVLLLHGVGDDRGRGAGHAHLTVHQHRLPALPVWIKTERERESDKINLSYHLRLMSNVNLHLNL